MSKFSYKPFYHRNLPHLQPEGATLFITFRLANSLPSSVVVRLMEERKQKQQQINKILDKNERERQLLLEFQHYFTRWDQALDSLAYGENFLSEPEIAGLVSDSLFHRDGKVFDLEAFCIMPNHVHLLFTPLKDSEGSFFSLSRIMHSLKRYTTRESNRILLRQGPFWQHESYDHFIRNEAEFKKTIEYVLLNPVKAGLVEDWTQWKWSFSKYDV
jgi:putative transposase